MRSIRLGMVVVVASCSLPTVHFSPGDGGATDVSIDAPPSMFQSCNGLAMTCGPNGNDTCCASPEVPGGSYLRGHDVATDGMFPSTSYPATVSNFRLDKYEVTVGRFRAFVAAGMGTQASPPAGGAGAHPKLAGSGWDASFNASLTVNTAALVAAIKCNGTFQTWTDTPAGNEDRPMNCITWFEAMAFCAWDGGYLATEAEWNCAATGGDQQRAYPWSSPAGYLGVDENRASYWVDGTKQCLGDGVYGCALTDLVLVGTKPAGGGRWGQSDLGGNVGEWTLDWKPSYPNPCTDCANLTPATYRVIRGGGFDDAATSLRAASAIYNALPTLRDYYVGVRCARTP